MESYLTGVEVKILKVKGQSSRDPGSSFSLKTSIFQVKGVSALEMEGLG